MRSRTSPAGNLPSTSERSPNPVSVSRYQCLIDGYSYDRKELAEAHVRLQHSSMNYDLLTQKAESRDASRTMA